MNLLQTGFSKQTQTDKNGQIIFAYSIVSNQKSRQTQDVPDVICKLCRFILLSANKSLPVVYVNKWYQPAMVNCLTCTQIGDLMPKCAIARDHISLSNTFLFVGSDYWYQKNPPINKKPEINREREADKTIQTHKSTTYKYYKN